MKRLTTRLTLLFLLASALVLSGNAFPVTEPTPQSVFLYDTSIRLNVELDAASAESISFASSAFRFGDAHLQARLADMDVADSFAVRCPEAARTSGANARCLEFRTALEGRFPITLVNAQRSESDGEPAVFTADSVRFGRSRIVATVGRLQVTRLPDGFHVRSATSVN